MSASKRFVKQVYQDFVNKRAHEAMVMPNLKIVSAHPKGHVSTLLPVRPENVNRLDTLHGAVICSLVDTIGSLALSSKGLWLTGVSTDISVSFIRSSKPGDTIRCEGHVLSLGRTLAFTRIDIFSEQDKLIATGTHTKQVVEALKNKTGRNVTFTEDGESVVEGQLADD